MSLRICMPLRLSTLALALAATPALARGQRGTLARRCDAVARQVSVVTWAERTKRD